MEQNKDRTAVFVTVRRNYQSQQERERKKIRFLGSMAERRNLKLDFIKKYASFRTRLS